jgi:hypothetical protein
MIHAVVTAFKMWVVQIMCRFRVNVFARLVKLSLGTRSGKGR